MSVVEGIIHVKSSRSKHTDTTKPCDYVYRGCREVNKKCVVSDLSGGKVSGDVEVKEVGITIFHASIVPLRI